MSWLIYSLLTAVLWAFGQFFIKKAAISVTPLWNIVINALFALLFYLPVAISHGTPFAISPFTFLIIFLGATLYNLYYYAVEKGVLLITGTILAMYPLVTVLLSLLFLHEEFTLLKSLSCLFILIGILLTIYRKEKKTRNRLSPSFLLLSLVGMVSLGTADFFAKVMIDTISLNSYLLFLPFAFVLSSSMFWLVDKKGRILKIKRSTKEVFYAILGVAMLTAGLLSFNTALQTGSVSLVSLLSSTYVGITFFLAFLFLKERITFLQFLGCGSMFLGILLISLLQ